MIPFNKPPITGKERKHLLKSIQNPQISGDGIYTKKCEEWFETSLQCKKALLTPSCTQALEMAALLIGIQKGDEVIMPSYTFVSTANAFVLHGATIVFVDINPQTMNIDETKIEEAITSKTKAIVPVHYAGVACEMNTIMQIAKKHNLFVIEDAAQCITSTYQGKPIGTIGHFGTFSFHETKNITSAGEGGLLIINDQRFLEQAEIIREKGTNRSAFFRGMVDKYTWVDKGSSYLLNDVSASFLWAQLKQVTDICNNRLKSWHLYYKLLKPLEAKYNFILPYIPENISHNAHMFYIKVGDLEIRTQLIEYLKKHDINAVFHYIPLHSSQAGLQFGRMSGIDQYTTVESEKILRLPLYYNLKIDDIHHVCEIIKDFFTKTHHETK